MKSQFIGMGVANARARVPWLAQACGIVPFHAMVWLPRAANSGKPRGFTTMKAKLLKAQRAAHVALKKYQAAYEQERKKLFVDEDGFSTDDSTLDVLFYRLVAADAEELAVAAAGLARHEFSNNWEFWAAAYSSAKRKLNSNAELINR